MKHPIKNTYGTRHFVLRGCPLPEIILYRVFNNYKGTFQLVLCKEVIPIMPDTNEITFSPYIILSHSINTTGAKKKINLKVGDTFLLATIHNNIRQMHARFC